MHYVHYCRPDQNKDHHDTRLCVVVNVVYIPKVYIPNYYRGVIDFFKIKYQIQNAQDRRSGEKSNSRI